MITERPAMVKADGSNRSMVAHDGYRRVPGLFTRWELADVVEPGHEYRFLDAGRGPLGMQLIRAYRRPLVRRRHAKGRP